MESVENDNVLFWKKDGILFFEIKKPLDITKDVLSEIIQLRHQISNNEMQYLCNDMGQVKSYNKEARDYTEKYGQDFLHAAAMLVNSHLTKFIFNTVAFTKKVNVPMRAFKTKEAAIKWLLEIKRQNEAKSNE